MTTLSKQLASRYASGTIRFERVTGDATVVGQTVITTQPDMAENSELVWINGVFLDGKQGDYVADYGLGTITLSEGMDVGDEYLVLYSMITIDPYAIETTQFGRASGDATEGQDELFTEYNISPNSELVLINGTILDRNQGHYTVDYTSGVVTLTTPLQAGDRFLVLYSMLVAVQGQHMTNFTGIGIGDGVTTDFILPHRNRQVEFVMLDRNYLAIQGVDYVREVLGGIDIIRFQTGYVPDNGTEIHVALG